MRSLASASSSCERGACTPEYASCKDMSPYCFCNGEGIAEDNSSLRSACNIQPRIPFCVTEPETRYTGTNPFISVFPSSGSNVGLTRFT